MAAIPSVASRAVASFVDLFFALFLFSSPDRISSSVSDSFAAFSVSCLVILLETIFSSASAVVSLTVSVISVSNGGRRTAFLSVQYQRFFDFSRLPAAARRRTYFVRRRIFSPSPAKARSVSIETTVGASRDTSRAKAVTVSPMHFFPTDA